MNPIEERLNSCFDSIRERLPFRPKTALVLGSGLGGYAESGDIRTEGFLDYQEIEGVRYHFLDREAVQEAAEKLGLEKG